MYFFEFASGLGSKAVLILKKCLVIDGATVHTIHIMYSIRCRSILKFCSQNTYNLI